MKCLSTRVYLPIFYPGSCVVVSWPFSFVFSCSVDKEDEITCLIKGCNFLLKNIPDEVFIYQRHGTTEYRFQGVEHDMFPYLLVNIGSGVSLIKVRALIMKCLSTRDMGQQSTGFRG